MGSVPQVLELVSERINIPCQVPLSWQTPCCLDILANVDPRNVRKKTMFMTEWAFKKLWVEAVCG